MFAAADMAKLHWTVLRILRWTFLLSSVLLRPGSYVLVEYGCVGRDAERVISISEYKKDVVKRRIYTRGFISLAYYSL